MCRFSRSMFRGMSPPSLSLCRSVALFVVCRVLLVVRSRLRSCVGGCFAARRVRVAFASRRLSSRVRSAAFRFALCSWSEPEPERDATTRGNGNTSHATHCSHTYTITRTHEKQSPYSYSSSHTVRKDKSNETYVIYKTERCFARREERKERKGKTHKLHNAVSIVFFHVYSSVSSHHVRWISCVGHRSKKEQTNERKKTRTMQAHTEGWTVPFPFAASLMSLFVPLFVLVCCRPLSRKVIPHLVKKSNHILKQI